MRRDNKQGPRTEEGEGFGLDAIEQVIRERGRATIEVIVEEELEAALGASPGARVGEQRQGYRHGSRARQLTTSVGATTLRVPRARLHQGAGGSTEGQSRVLPNEEAVVLLLFGLLRSGQVRLRRFVGWQEMSSASPLQERQAA